MKLKWVNTFFNIVKTSTSKTIFRIRSKTLDFKTWNQCKYKDELCVRCLKTSETVEHFVSCDLYENTRNID